MSVFSTLLKQYRLYSGLVLRGESTTGVPIPGSSLSIPAYGGTWHLVPYIGRAVSTFGTTTQLDYIALPTSICTFDFSACSSRCSTSIKDDYVELTVDSSGTNTADAEEYKITFTVPTAYGGMYSATQGSFTFKEIANDVTSISLEPYINFESTDYTDTHFQKAEEGTVLSVPYSAYEEALSGIVLVKVKYTYTSGESRYLAATEEDITAATTALQSESTGDVLYETESEMTALGEDSDDYAYYYYIDPTYTWISNPEETTERHDLAYSPSTGYPGDSLTASTYFEYNLIEPDFTFTLSWSRRALSAGASAINFVKKDSVNTGNFTIEEVTPVTGISLEKVSSSLTYGIKCTAADTISAGIAEYKIRSTDNTGVWQRLYINTHTLTLQWYSFTGTAGTASQKMSYVMYDGVNTTNFSVSTYGTNTSSYVTASIYAEYFFHVKILSGASAGTYQFKVQHKTYSELYKIVTVTVNPSTTTSYKATVNYSIKNAQSFAVDAPSFTINFMNGTTTKFAVPVSTSGVLETGESTSGTSTVSLASSTVINKLQAYTPETVNAMVTVKIGSGSTYTLSISDGGESAAKSITSQTFGSLTVTIGITIGMSESTDQVL